MALLHSGRGLDGGVLSLRSDNGSMAAQQTVSSLPDGFAGTSFASGIRVSAEVDSLCANRLHNTIAVFSIDNTGHLNMLATLLPWAIIPRSSISIQAGIFSTCATSAATRSRAFGSTSGQAYYISQVNTRRSAPHMHYLHDLILRGTDKCDPLACSTLYCWVKQSCPAFREDR